MTRPPSGSLRIGAEDIGVVRTGMDTGLFEIDPDPEFVG